MVAIKIPLKNYHEIFGIEWNLKYISCKTKSQRQERIGIKLRPLKNAAMKVK